MREWQSLAERGDPQAQFNLGLLCARGQGGSRDYAQAAEWYRKAAAQGVAAAAFSLGVLYTSGKAFRKATSRRSIGIARRRIGGMPAP